MRTLPLERLIYDPDASVRGEAVVSSAYCLGSSKTAELVRKSPEDTVVAFVEQRLVDTDRSLARQVRELLDLVREYGPEAVATAMHQAHAAGAFGADYIGNLLILEAGLTPTDVSKAHLIVALL